MYSLHPRIALLDERETTAMHAEVVGRYFSDVLGAADGRAAQELLHRRVKVVGAGTPVAGAADLLTYVRALHVAFPDLSVEPLEGFVAGDRAAVWFALRGTHAGPFRGIGPTGRTIDVRGIDMFRLERRRITTIHAAFDRLGQMQQLFVPPFAVGA